MPTDPPDGSDLASQLDRLRRALALMEQAAEAAERSAALRREAEALMPGISNTLTPDESLHHNRTEMQAIAPAIRYRRGRPSESTHRFSRWLEAQESSLAAWAEGHGLKRERVKGWVAEGAARRRIPRMWADLIEREATDPKTKKSALPATLATWPQGIVEPTRGNRT